MIYNTATLLVFKVAIWLDWSGLYILKKRLNSSKSVFVELPGWSHFNIKFGLKIDLNEIIEKMKLSNNAKLLLLKKMKH